MYPRLFSNSLCNLECSWPLNPFDSSSLVLGLLEVCSTMLGGTRDGTQDSWNPGKNSTKWATFPTFLIFWNYFISSFFGFALFRAVFSVPRIVSGMFKSAQPNVYCTNESGSGGLELGFGVLGKHSTNWAARSGLQPSQADFKFPESLLRQPPKYWYYRDDLPRAVQKEIFFIWWNRNVAEHGPH